MTDTKTVVAAVAVDVPLLAGGVYHLREGTNESVPEAVATSWFAKAAGCQVVGAEPARKPKSDKQG